MNKDLILREQLAWERTKMAIQRTSLSFLRTSLYFVVAGISIRHALDFNRNILVQWLLIGIGLVILIIGIINHKRATKKLLDSKKHIGNYVLEYEDEI